MRCLDGSHDNVAHALLAVGSDKDVKDNVGGVGMYSVCGVVGMMACVFGGAGLIA